MLHEKILADRYDQLWQAREKLKTENAELLREKDNLTKENTRLLASKEQLTKEKEKLAVKISGLENFNNQLW